jgi:hypothetical protein
MAKTKNKVHNITIEDFKRVLRISEKKLCFISGRKGIHT